MAITQKLLAGDCEITTGVFTPTATMPTFQGENNAIKLEISFYRAGTAYTIPADVEVRAYLYYGAKPAMTPAVLMTADGNVAACDIGDTFLAMAGSPVMVIRMMDGAGDILVACAFDLSIKSTLAGNVITVGPPSPDEIVYIGRSPYIGSNGNWYVWAADTQSFEDSGEPSMGLNGWTPILAVVTDGARRVQQVTDWTGGTGTKPATGQYVGPSGYVANIAQAVDIRGGQGIQGIPGTPGAVQSLAVDGIGREPDEAGVVDLSPDFERRALWRQATGNPATCYPVPESRLYPEIDLVATQSGSGDPSPENVRPIVPSVPAGGKIKVRVENGSEIEITNATGVDWYGLPDAPDWVSADGGRRQGTALLTFSGNESWTLIETYATTVRFAVPLATILPVWQQIPWCSHFKGTTFGAEDVEAAMIGGSNFMSLKVKKTRLSTLDSAGLKQWIAGLYNLDPVNHIHAVRALYRRATPLILTNPATPIYALPQLDKYTPRLNVMSADIGGDTSHIQAVRVGYAKSPIRESDELQAAIAALA